MGADEQRSRDHGEDAMTDSPPTDADNLASSGTATTGESLRSARRAGPTARGFRWFSATLLLAAAAAAAWLYRGAGGEQTAQASEAPTVEGRTIGISAKLRERLAIETTAVRMAPLTPLVRTVGTVTFDPAYVGAAGVRLRGVVNKVYKYEGDVVKRGELLGEVVSSELGSAQASVLMYEAQVHSAELNAKRETELAERGLTTTREVEEASAALAEYRSKLLAAEQQVSALGGAAVKEKKVRAIGLHQLRSPIDGTVVARFVAPGQSVEGNLTAFRVADLNHLWVELAIFERDLSSVRKGDRVELRPLSEQQESIRGEVAHVGEVVDPSTRAGEVRVEIDNHERKLRAGQAVSAKIHVTGGGTADVAQVPSAAITYVDGKPTVFVAESPLRFVATPVVVGESDGEDRQILSGVKVGSVVVCKGVFGLKSELFR
jgi:cobalt-zinc-cadmium efflux system membrane fusion protein